MNVNTQDEPAVQTELGQASQGSLHINGNMQDSRSAVAPHATHPCVSAGVPAEHLR